MARQIRTSSTTPAPGSPVVGRRCGRQDHVHETRTHLVLDKDAPGSANRCSKVTCHPRRTSSPLRPSLSFRYTQGPGPSPAPRLSPPQKLLVERRILLRQRLLDATCGPHAGGGRGPAGARGLLCGGRLVAVRVGAVVLVEPRLRCVEAFPAR